VSHQIVLAWGDRPVKECGGVFCNGTGTASTPTATPSVRLRELEPADLKRAGPGTIDKRVYRRLIRQFQHDIHNGRVLNQYELSRYHVLAQDLVAPIDHYFQHRRRKGIDPMGTFDRLFIAMGIHLAHIHGADNVVLLTADDGIADIVGKRRDGIPANTVRKLKLEIAEEVTGRKFGPELFPRCLNLKTATRAELEECSGRGRCRSGAG
jgi:hypothetical protein